MADAREIADDRRLTARPSWLVAAESRPAGQQECPGFGLRD